MTRRSSKRWQDFERDRILGGFDSHKPTREFGRNADGLNARPERKRGPAEVSVVRDAGQGSLNETTGSRPANDDREAIERGEDEGMSLGRM